VVTANLINKNESFVIEIEASKVAALMEVFNSNFALMADHLKLMDDRMVLINPRFDPTPLNVQS
jgi:hypothetical protein